MISKQAVINISWLSQPFWDGPYVKPAIVWFSCGDVIIVTIYYPTAATCELASGLLMRSSVVCRVCWSRSWALQKRLNRSRYRLCGWLRWAQGTVYYIGVEIPRGKWYFLKVVTVPFKSIVCRYCIALTAAKSQPHWCTDYSPEDTVYRRTIHR